MSTQLQQDSGATISEKSISSNVNADYGHMNNHGSQMKMSMFVIFIAMFSYINVFSMKWNTIKIDTRIFVTFWIQNTWAVADDERSDNCFLSRLSWLLIRLLLLVRSNLLKMTNMTFLLSSSPEMLLDKMQLNVAVSVSDVFKTYKYNYQWGF